LTNNSTIKVTVPNFCVAETSYTWSCLLETFLNVPYSLDISSLESDFVLAVGSNKLVIKNYFFDSEETIDDYSQCSIPSEVDMKAVIVREKEFPLVSIYGYNKLEHNVLYSDIISSTFFMLTRWEESVNLERDEHNRFLASDSIAFKFGFLHRPIVNEYVELLWSLLCTLGYNGSRLRRSYSVVPTHDVDYPSLWNSNLDKLRAIGFSIFKNPSLLDLTTKIRSLTNKVDIYDTYGILMDYADQANCKAHFNFMSNATSEYDSIYNLDDVYIQNIVSTILSRGHVIGFHPSYNSYNDSELFNSELLAINSHLNVEVISGRQHYLRCDIPLTLDIWNDNNLVWDSTLGYANEFGFRCGVCYPFPVFNFQKRVPLNIIERPLIVMDVTLAIYKGLSGSAAIRAVDEIKDTIKKYNGEFVFLWHNSSFQLGVWSDYHSVLKNMYL